MDRKYRRKQRLGGSSKPNPHGESRIIHQLYDNLIVNGFTPTDFTSSISQYESQEDEWDIPVLTKLQLLNISDQQRLGY